MTIADQARHDRAHLTRYGARLLKPLTAHRFNGEGPDRTVPGGALVDVTENTDHIPGQVVITFLVLMDGVLYARDLDPDRSQFRRL